MSQIRKVIGASQQQVEDEANLEASGLPKQASELYCCVKRDSQLLGEDLLLVKREIRPLYFGLKNIILQEIESLDKEIDVHKFFIEEETAGFPASTHNMQAYVVNRSRAMFQGG